MHYNHPYIENADNKLAEIAISGIHSRYSDEQLEDAMARIEEELEIIKRQGSASEYLVVINAFNAVNARSNEYCMRGTTPSLLIAYATGLSDVDPLNCTPRIYPEFSYGIKGDKMPSFEFNVSSDLHSRIFEYYDNYPGKEPVTRKYDEMRQFVGVYIGEIDEKTAVGGLYYDTFYINYIEIKDELMMEKILLHDEIIEQCKPKNLEEYVKCYGFKHSTGAWEDNAELLYKDSDVPFCELIANREDVYEYLLDHGVDKTMAFSIAQYVRMGKAKRRGWKDDMFAVMKIDSIPDWFIESCEKVDYLFTRAHAMSFFKSYTSL